MDTDIFKLNPNLPQTEEEFGHYLAGIIEGDGNIIQAFLLYLLLQISP